MKKLLPIGGFVLFIAALLFGLWHSYLNPEKQHKTGLGITPLTLAVGEIDTISLTAGREKRFAEISGTFKLQGETQNFRVRMSFYDAMAFLDTFEMKKHTFVRTREEVWEIELPEEQLPNMNDIDRWKGEDN